VTDEVNAPGGDTPRISAVVPTYGRSRLLPGAVVSLLSQDLPAREFEVLVVDNNPQPEMRGTVEGLARARPGVEGPTLRYIHEPRLGLHNARHAAARAARAPVIALIDDDAVADPGWLRALLAAYDDPAIAAVGGKLVPRWEAEPPAWIRELPGVYLSLLDHGPRRRDVSWQEGIYGCNFSVRVDALRAVGGFNPECVGDRWLGDGESGLLRKLEAAGYRIVYTPDAVVHHIIPAQRASREGMMRRFANYGANDSYVAFREKRPGRPRLGLRALALATLSAAYGAAAQAARMAGLERFNWYSLRQAYYRSRASYELRLVFDRSLRQFAERENWLNES